MSTIAPLGPRPAGLWSGHPLRAVVRTTPYTFGNTNHAANLFALKEVGNIYTSIMNPTQAAVEARLAALERGVGALLVSSGQAAETIALLNIAEADDHIVSSSSLYGGTYNLGPVAAVAHEVGLPLVVDNTVATPCLIRPIEWGAEVVVHSATSRSQISRLGLCPGSRAKRSLRHQPLIHPQGPRAVASRSRLRRGAIQYLADRPGAGNPVAAKQTPHRWGPTTSPW